MSKQHIDWQGICQEPFRLFFPLAILLGLIGVSHWLWYALGWASKTSAFYHASAQVTGYMFCFIAGFLLTALPRFSATKPSSSMELTALLSLLIVQQVLAWFERWMAAGACWAALLLVLFLFAGRRFASFHKAPQAQPPTEFIWVFLALLMGVAGSLLTVLAQAEVLPGWWIRIGIPMSQQGFLLGVVVGVGGFMGPRLMGLPLSNLVPKQVGGKQAHSFRQRRIWLHLSAGLLFLTSFLLEATQQRDLAYLLRAAVVTAEVLWLTRCYRRPRTQGTYVGLLWVSFWMILLGLWGAWFFPVYRVTMLHIVFLGGFSLMTFSVGTMVVLSHAGQVEKLRRPLPILWWVAAGVVAALAARVTADFFPGKYFFLLGFAAACWAAAAALWLGFIFPKVLAASPHENIRRIHEKAGVKL